MVAAFVTMLLNADTRVESKCIYHVNNVNL